MSFRGVGRIDNATLLRHGLLFVHDGVVDRYRNANQLDARSDRNENNPNRANIDRRVSLHTNHLVVHDRRVGARFRRTKSYLSDRRTRGNTMDVDEIDYMNNLYNANETSALLDKGKLVVSLPLVPGYNG